ncbi:hypothetical protein BIV25_45030 [Streptomyces sp. MUSC 14]|uniref:hypothetical protein n=1 Tax=Streptomyces sp. MUSC 14 TaxID=1354889 RepID=UPI0008F5F382|nr:hypothetical protein [Streptomyces sp. MUSC 14]OIJ85071.1 hypothetical protein BIV25_45030 [Streptomyces sp. MUSC 14]
MTTPTLLDVWGEIPTGTQWPGSDTLVLLNRDIRPETDLSRLSRFSDDRWDLNPAIFEDHYPSTTLNFALIPAELRLAAKFYLWQLLNHTESRRVRGARGKRSAVVTIARAFSNGLQFVLQWLASRQVTQFCQVTQELLDDYLVALEDEEVPLDYRYRRLTEVRRLWAYRDTLPLVMRLPDAPPWAGEDTQDLLRGTRVDRENRTRRIAEPTMQMLLLWAIRFVEDFAEDILAAHAERLQLHANTTDGRRRAGTNRQPRHRSGELRPKVIAYLNDLRERGEGLPGIRTGTGKLVISWRHIAAALNCAESFRHTTTACLVTESGLPVGEHAYVGSSISGLLDGQPWRPDRIHYDEVPQLTRLLSTACFIIVAYLSGARVGEVLNLRRGCVTQDTNTGLWLMEGLYFKGAEDQDGNKIPEGQVRHDPWVVIELLASAVNVLERLHPSPLLFPIRIEHYLKRQQGGKRLGEARRDNEITKDLGRFVAWVNTECDRRGRTDRIPDDGRDRLKASRFRRTLAWFIRRRPRGLIAASIQYGHAHTRMLQGYAGTYESGFPDEYAFEDWLYRLECLADDEQALTSGEHVSGPAADAYRYRVNAASREFAGRVLTKERQARDLLSNTLLQIYHGEGMTCVLNPATAACQLRGNADDPLVTPDTDDCRPKCPNLARTDRDIQYVKRRATELAEIVADPLAPPIRHERERRELDRLKTIIEVHERGAADR